MTIKLLFAILLGFSAAFAAKPAQPGQPIRGIGMIFNNGQAGLAQGQTYYYTVPFGCVIQAWNMTAFPVDSSVTIDVWKASGSYPTASDSITASATPAISGATPLHSTNLAGWNTAISQNDTLAFYISAADGVATQASLVLQCQ